ncbi:MAG: 2-C-methyl-D-erythritol 4-phosphate cytidylyltransferase [Colwellia sp.]
MVIVPAAGVGKRMLANCPKQYLTINNITILEHTVNCLLSHPQIKKVVLSISDDDHYFKDSALANNDNVIRVSGGKERVDSVLNGLRIIDKEQNPWILVHDAARPCISHQDISALISQCISQNRGGLLASPVRDTMKRSSAQGVVKQTVDRDNLWHGLTPQMYKTSELIVAIEQALVNDIVITDESSAIEQANLPSILVSGSGENIKITHPDDLLLAAFFLNKNSKK